MPLLSRYYPGNYSEEQYILEKRIVRHSLFVSGSMVIVLWLVKLFEFEFQLDFSTWGVLPLDVKGLSGILFSPLIHANFEHLIANTLPLFVLVFSLFFFYRKSSYTIFVLIYLLSGVFVWLGGREALHIGASGVIYGLAAFLFLSGIISFNIRLLTISMIVSLIYGGMFWGIFPIKPDISWESHLWGGISGLGLALHYRKSIPTDHSDEEIDENIQENEIEPEEDTTEENN
ncbi:MAG: rhomboid family intramembrane serine protease [Bacteroidia bacterium]|nr:rhomboid family intramembrane serine protease [Bacteroidia bacterium]